jgi:hypothetical protein
MRTFERVRRRFFPRALYMQREDGRLRAETRESERPPRDGR